MLVLLSPAKRLNAGTTLPPEAINMPLLMTEAMRVHAALAKLSPKKLQQLQNISADLAQQNWQRNQQWQQQPEAAVYQKALFLFNGDAYQGLDAPTLSNIDLTFAQTHLRILSGLYGWLKPMDLIEPYRLEMGTALKVGRNANLYDFWRKTITNQLGSEFADEPVINLASVEYSSVVDRKKLKNTFIEVLFKDRNADGQYKVMSFYAKRARGLMARYIVQNQLNDPEKLVHFSTDGYQFADNESSPTNLVFLRDH